MKASMAALFGAAVLGGFGGSGCAQPSSGSAASTDRTSLAHGADITWLTQLEASGVTWVDEAGTKLDPVAELKGRGLDAIRLRVMVNPSSTSYLSSDGKTPLGYCDEAGVAALAERCAAAGFDRFLIDFHFSDTWADPSHQKVPAAWAGHDLTTLATDLSAHVTSVLAALKAKGVTPRWVQLGNEETQGILWGSPASGKVSGTTGWTSLATLLNAGYAAVKAADPAIQVVLHLDRGGENDLYHWWFDNYKAAGGKWDVTAVSFYPYWQPADTVAMLQANLTDLVSRYSRPVLVAEVGGPAADPAATQALLAQVKSAVLAVPGDQGLGVFYWEPLAAASVVNGYALGASQVYAGKALTLTTAINGLGYK